MVTFKAAPDEAFTARYERGGAQWTARAQVKGKEVVASGRTLQATRTAFVTELAAIFQAYPPAMIVRDDIALPDECTKAIAEARDARAAAAEAAARAQEALRAAARLLVAEHGLSYRDAAYALGISHPRIQQVIGEDNP